MKKLFALSIALLLMMAVNGCVKETDEPETPQAPETSVEQVEAAAEKADEATQEVAKEATEAVEKAAEEVKAATKLVPIPLELPKAMFVGTPENLSGIENMEKPLGKPRPAFLAPEGVTNLAAGKPVTAFEMEPIAGDLEMIVDGDKDATEGSVVELGPFEQWVQIDLEKEAEIYAIVFWHYHKSARVYFDIVIQVSNDEEFITDVTTIYNNDLDNSLALGVGSDPHYVETAEGRLVDAKGVKGRYVRLYSQANNQNDYSHYIEVEVYGK
ncbi:MAG: discoidin domain-containing protein [Planctomycetota bacterium]|jgi:hypothetical protein